MAESGQTDARVAEFITDLRQALEEAGKTAVIVVQDGEALGAIAVRDEPRQDAAVGIASLRRLGVECVMLTGDNRGSAAVAARTLGIDEVVAELLPQDKAEAVAQLKEGGRKVAMVGDGVNDDVIDLYNRVSVGTKVIVLPDRAHLEAKAAPVAPPQPQARLTVAGTGSVRAFGLY